MTNGIIRVYSKIPVCLSSCFEENSNSSEQRSEQTDTANAASESSAEPIKPHQRRAINFLVNEYLLLHDYKLTYVTFAEENEDQVCGF